MKLEDIRTFTRKLPFEPFVINLLDGRSLAIPNLDSIAVGSRSAAIINPHHEGGEVIYFPFDEITSINKLEPTA